VFARAPAICEHFVFNAVASQVEAAEQAHFSATNCNLTDAHFAVIEAVSQQSQGFEGFTLQPFNLHFVATETVSHVGVAGLQ